MRVAWFSPLPPGRSGIATYSAELLPRLAARHEIHAFVDEGHGGRSPRTVAVSGVTVFGAHDFPWRHATQPYDVVVFQLGNDVCHHYMWPYMVRYPGLVVLHDGQVHQARAKGLIGDLRADDYRAEFEYCHPDAVRGIADLTVSGLGASLYYLWPMLRVPVEAARVLAVHNAWLEREIAGLYPASTVIRVRPGVVDPSADARASRAEVLARHGVPPDSIVVGSFGRVTPEKGLSDALMALAQLADAVPLLRLLVVGGADGNHDVMAEARQRGVEDRVAVTGYVEDDRLAEYLAAVDICLNLRWPTARETSAAWLRCLAAGKPTIVTDLAHTTDVPSLDLRSNTVRCTTPGVTVPVCVAVELLEEVYMLRISLRRLAEDAALRTRLSAAARRYWAAEAGLDVMVRDYDTALAQTAAAPDPNRAGWPAHLLADGTRQARAISTRFGISLDW